MTLKGAVSNPEEGLGITLGIFSITHLDEDCVWLFGRETMGWQQYTGPTHLETTDIICGIDTFFHNLETFQKINNILFYGYILHIKACVTKDGLQKIHNNTPLGSHHSNIK